MGKATFNSNVKEVIANIESIGNSYKVQVLNYLCDLTELAFKQTDKKYIVHGNWVKENNTGKLIPTVPPGGNIAGKAPAWVAPNGKFTRFQKANFYVKGKVVSRSGKYEKEIENIISTGIVPGKNDFDEVTIEVDPKGIRVYADSDGEVFKVECLTRDKKKAITKAFQSIVNMWKNYKIKLSAK